MGALRTLILPVLILVLTAVSPVVMAQPVPPTCDENFYDIMSARSWTQGKQDMEVAQKLILKPDSVLEYSCFNARISELNNSSIFVSPSGTMNEMVTDPTESYLENNFRHTLGGGSVGNPGGTCAAMFAVWDALKCRNFDIDDFKTFTEVSLNDDRTLPAACSGGSRSIDWAIQEAFSDPDPGAPGGVQPATTYLSSLNPARCANHRPIPTGLMIKPVGGAAAYPDAICAAPGCYYTGAGNRCAGP